MASVADGAARRDVLDRGAGRTVALVSCVKLKQEPAAPAAELYVSPLFRASRAYAERLGVPWWVLSAEHGLLAPDTVIAPYERTLKTMRVDERRAWGARVAEQLERVLLPGTTVVLLAGRAYSEPLVPHLERLGCVWDDPMKGLGLGRHQTWLKRQLAT